MNVIESAVKETNLDSDIDAQRPCFPRRAVDPDAALVEGLRRADPEAVEALVNTYGDRVYRLAIRITGNTADAEEVVNERRPWQGPIPTKVGCEPIPTKVG